MALAFSNLTSGASTVDASSFTTASITPPSDTLILLTVSSRLASGAPNTPTVSGCGLTWVEITNVVNTGGNRRLTCFRARGSSPTSGTLTIDFGGQSQTEASWISDYVTDSDSSGTNGSGAIVQSATGSAASGTTSTVTLAAFGSSSNAAYGVHVNTNPSAITPGSGFTELAENSTSESGTDMQSEYKLNDTTVDATWTGSGSWYSLAVEIKQATTVADTTSFFQLF